MSIFSQKHLKLNTMKTLQNLTETENKLINFTVAITLFTIAVCIVSIVVNIATKIN